MWIMERVGIRELRENLRRYLERAAHGDAFVVTEFGRPLARLGPLPDSGSRYHRLVAEGRVTPARRRIDQLPLPRASARRGAAAAVIGERADDTR